MAEYEHEDYQSHFKNIYKVTNVTKYRDFQYRLLHNKIFCNNILIHWKKVDSAVCNLCTKEKQDILHLIVHCTRVQPLWKWLQKQFEKVQIVTKFSEYSIMFNLVHEQPQHICNFIALITKQYIFRCKCLNEKPNIHELNIEIDNMYEIELYNARKNNMVSKHVKKWSPVKDISHLIESCEIASV